MAKKLHYQAADQTVPPCGINKLAEKEHFTIVTTTDPNQVRCRMCNMWLIEHKLAPDLRKVETGDMDLSFMIGLGIKQAFAAAHANKTKGMHFIQLVAEDGEFYPNRPTATRNDRILLEANDNLIVKAYVG